VVGAYSEPSCGRRDKPIHSIPYSVAQPLERGSKNYYSIIQGAVQLLVIQLLQLFACQSDGGVLRQNKFTVQGKYQLTISLIYFKLVLRY